MKECPKCGRKFLVEMDFCAFCSITAGGPLVPPAIPPLPVLAPSLPSTTGVVETWHRSAMESFSPAPPGYGIAPPTLPQAAASPTGPGRTALQPLTGYLPEIFETVFGAARETMAEKMSGGEMNFDYIFTSMEAAPEPHTTSASIPLWPDAHATLRDLFMRAATGDEPQAEEIYYSTMTTLLAVREMLHGIRCQMRKEGMGPVSSALYAALTEAGVACVTTCLPGFPTERLQGYIGQLVDAGVAMGYTAEPDSRFAPKTQEEAKEDPGRAVHFRLLVARKIIESGRVRPFREVVQQIIQGEFPVEKER